MHYSDIVETETETCNACPLQFEGTMVDGRQFYFRYRWGHAFLGIGRTLQEAIHDDGVSFEIGAELDGWMSRSDYEKTFVSLYLLHPQGNVIQSSTED